LPTAVRFRYTGPMLRTLFLFVAVIFLLLICLSMGSIALIFAVVATPFVVLYLLGTAACRAARSAFGFLARGGSR
jgi:hypothetical protein